MNTFPSTLWILGILGTILPLGRREGPAAPDALPHELKQMPM